MKISHLEAGKSFALIQSVIVNTKCKIITQMESALKYTTKEFEFTSGHSVEIITEEVLCFWRSQASEKNIKFVYKLQNNIPKILYINRYRFQSTLSCLI